MASSQPVDDLGVLAVDGLVGGDDADERAVGVPPGIGVSGANAALTPSTVTDSVTTSSALCDDGGVVALDQDVERRDDAVGHTALRQRLQRLVGRSPAGQRARSAPARS